ncbi:MULTISPECIES: hypothetical protein [unclassified Streptomyces]|uniref:hypothetical protein n=1 Tax=unclassified Streptomyces TaxID=2593676 RepID=UPI000DB974D7|nr:MULTISPECIES: hypothetical protein [unclassified Streptomyces]MYT68374.1 hypothetical protein [Streptomyces sp. SID8367]RAJ77011.1 hypothetical protein K377_06180 [Streptomyces sp. PsTaAH-137]
MPTTPSRRNTAPQPRHVVQFSGGVGSFLTALHVARTHGTDRMTLLIADTGIEDEDLWRFSDDTAALLNVPLTIVRDGRTPWEVFHDRRFLGNDRLAPCTTVLKQLPCRAWMERHAPADRAIVYVGIEPTARDRARTPAIVRNWAPWPVEFPLTAGPDRTKQQLLDEVRATGVRPPRLYDLGFSHNNCGGTCVRAGQRQWKLLRDVLPDRFDRAAIEEFKLRALLGDVAILRDRRGGTVRPLPLTELRDRP